MDRIPLPGSVWPRIPVFPAPAPQFEQYVWLEQWLVSYLKFFGASIDRLVNDAETKDKIRLAYKVYRGLERQHQADVAASWEAWLGWIRQNI